MELIDKKQAESFKRFARRLGGDPARLRMTLCVLLAGVGIFGVERPLGLRLAKARAANLAARKSSQMAEEVAFFTRQNAAFAPRVNVSTDISDWQNYVLERLRCTTATLISLEPRKPLAKGVFTVLEMELVAKGSSYREFADFVDRLEHGERLVRIEKLRMEKQQSSIYVTCLIRGLVRNGGKAAKPAAASAPLGPNVFVGPLQPGAESPATMQAGATESSTETSTEDSAEDATDDEAEPVVTPEEERDA